MKSKPPSKKAKLETGSSLTSGTSSSSEGKPKPKVLSAIKQEQRAAAAAAASSSSKVDAVGSASTKLGKGGNIGSISDISGGNGTSTALRLSFPILPIPEYPKLSQIATQHQQQPSSSSATVSSGMNAENSNDSTSTSNFSTPKTYMILMEDIDIIQHELESLWSVIAQRNRILKAENDILESVLNNSLSSTTNIVTVASLLGEQYQLGDGNAVSQEKLNTVKSIIESGHGTRTSVTAAAKLVLGTSTSTPSSLSSINSSPSSPNTGSISNNPSLSALLSSTSSGIGSSDPRGSTSLLLSNRKSNNSAAAAASCLITATPTQGASGPIVASTTLMGTGMRQPKKKLKCETGDKNKITGLKPTTSRIGQNRSHSISLDDSSVRQEAPNQFWEFVDSYCRDITKEDIDLLEKEIEEFRNIPESVFAIPNLGKHFSGVEKKENTEINGCGSTGTGSLRTNRFGIGSTGGNANFDMKGKDGIGPLTQRLVSSLVEDRVAQFKMNQQSSNNNNGDINGDSTETGRNDFQLIPRPSLVKALGLDGTGGVGGQIPLESRLKMVLADQDYIVGDIVGYGGVDSSNSRNDEVLTEIKRTFNTLKLLHNHNVEKLSKLAEIAKTELDRIPYKKELEKADKEIIAAYRSVASCRMKRKPITPKERAPATKALQYRQQIIEKLSNINTVTK